MRLITLVISLLLLCGLAGAQTHSFCASDSNCTVSGNWTFNGAANLKGSVPAIQNQPNRLTCFGDSMMAGWLADPLSNTANDYTASPDGFCQLMKADFPDGWANFAFAGDQAADMTLKMHADISPDDNTNPFLAAMIGTNDITQCGTSTGCQNNFLHSLISAHAHATIPRSAKLWGQDSAVAKTGTWTNDNTVRSGMGVKSSVAGDHVDFSVTFARAQNLYVNWFASDLVPGTATLSIDSGATSDTLSASGYNAQTILTRNGGKTSVFGNYYPLAAGTHTVRLTVASGTFTFLWAGWAANAYVYPAGQYAYGQPRLYAGAIINRTSDALGSTGTSSYIYSQLVLNLVRTLATDGLIDVYVDTRGPFSLNNTTDMGDSVHPNGPSALPAGCGHCALRDVFEFSMGKLTPSLYARVAANVQTRQLQGAGLAINSPYDAALGIPIRAGSSADQQININLQDHTGTTKQTIQMSAFDQLNLVDNTWGQSRIQLGTGTSGDNLYNVPSGRTHSFRTNGTQVASISAAGVIGGTGAVLNNANDATLNIDAQAGLTTDQQINYRFLDHTGAAKYQIQMSSFLQLNLVDLVWNQARIQLGTGTSGDNLYNVPTGRSHLFKVNGTTLASINGSGLGLFNGGVAPSSTGNVTWTSGAGAPAAGNCTTAKGGSLYSRTDGTTTTTLYVCDGATGVWTAK
jgi:hypothetical protein